MRLTIGRPLAQTDCLALHDLAPADIVGAALVPAQNSPGRGDSLYRTQARGFRAQPDRWRAS